MLRCRGGDAPAGLKPTGSTTGTALSTMDAVYAPSAHITKRSGVGSFELVSLYAIKEMVGAAGLEPATSCV